MNDLEGGISPIATIGSLPSEISSNTTFFSATATSSSLLLSLIPPLVIIPLIMKTAFFNNNLAAYSAYLIALTSSCFMLASILIFVPRHRLTNGILRCNLGLLSCSLVNFSLGIYISNEALLKGLSISSYLSFVLSDSSGLLILVLLLLSSGSLVRTFSELVLLLRVQAVFPDQRKWHGIGFFLVVLRFLLEFTGQLLNAFLSPNFRYLVCLGLAVECLNNILFSGLFISKLGYDGSATPSGATTLAGDRKKQVKKRLKVLKIIALENSLFPTLCSLLGLFLTFFHVYPNGWNVLMLWSYVVGIPAASVCTSFLAAQKQADDEPRAMTSISSKKSLHF